MTGRNYIHLPALTEMHQDLIQCRKEHHHYEQMYNEQCKRNEELRKRMIQSTELQRIKLENESKQKSVLKPNNAKAATAEKCTRK